MTKSGDAASLLVSLRGPCWHLWRRSCPRGAGFPTSLAAQLAAPELARSADRVLDREGALDTAREAAIGRLRECSKSGSVEDGRRFAKTESAVQESDVRRIAGSYSEKALKALACASDELARALFAKRPRLTLVIQGIVASPRLREAASWQNRKAIRTAFKSLLQQIPTCAGPRRVK